MKPKGDPGKPSDAHHSGHARAYGSTAAGVARWLSLRMDHGTRQTREHMARLRLGVVQSRGLGAANRGAQSQADGSPATPYHYLRPKPSTAGTP